MNAATRPFHLHGRQRLAALGAQVQQALLPLARDWWCDESRIQLAGVTSWDEELRASPLPCVVRESAEGWLAFLGAEHAWLKLAESWLNCGVASAGPLIQTLQREFCLAVYRSLTARDAAAVVLEEATWSQVPSHALQQGGGAVVVELDVDGVPLTLIAPLTLWPPLADWPQVRSAQPQQQVISVLRDTLVDVDVRLPCVRMPMTDMATLAVGDFLDLGYDLSGQVRVVGAAADLTLPAVLGQAGSRKAVQIETQDGDQ